MQLKTTTYKWVESETRKGGKYKKFALVEEERAMNEWCSAMNDDLEVFLNHHFGKKWIEKQVSFAMVRQGLDVGVVYARVKFPERMELTCKALVNEQEYHELKLLLLVVALTYKTHPHSAPIHHVIVHMGGGKWPKTK